MVKKSTILLAVLLSAIGIFLWMNSGNWVNIGVNKSRVEANLSATGVVSKRWTLLGPHNGRVNSLLLDDQTNRLLIGTNSGGMFYSGIKGNSPWVSLSNGLVSTNINHLIKQRNKIFAATGDGIYELRSWRKWIKIYNSDEQDDAVLLFTEDNKGQLWAISQKDIILFRNARSWQEIKSFPSTQLKTALFASSRGPVYVSSVDGLFQSNDYGNSWERIFDSVVSITEDNDGVLYIRTRQDYKLFKKLYGYTNFKELALSPFPKTGTLVFANEMLFAETFDALLISKDEGETFTAIKSPPISEPELFKKVFWDIRQIYPLKDGRVLLANDNGVSEVDVNAQSVKQLPPIKNYSEINSLAVSEKNKLILVAYWDHNAVFGLDDGKNWSPMFGGEAEFYYLNPVDDSVYIARNADYIFLISSANKSLPLQSWNYRIANPQTSVAIDNTVTPARVYAIYENFATNREGWLLSFDLTTDTSKLKVKEIKLPFAYLNSIAVAPKGKVIVLSESILYESLDYGNTWNQLVDLRNSVPLEITINPFNPDEIMIANISANEVFRVVKNKFTVLNLPTDKPNLNRVYSIVYDPERQNVIYAGSKRGFFYSTNNGSMWKLVKTNLYTQEIKKVIPLGNKIYVGSWGSGVASILKKQLLNNF